MLTPKRLHLFPAFLALLLAAGCGKPPKGPEVTFADIETTNAPAPALNSQTVRFDARQGSKVRIDGTSNIHDWQVEGSLIGGSIEAGPSAQTSPNGKDCNLDRLRLQ